MRDSRSKSASVKMRRHAEAVLAARPALEGAGVRLNCVFGFGHERRFDPFLMLDDFRADDPADFLAGFPWHPHRGIETITYVLRGDVEHADSLGNRGVIGSGDVQWMTAGSGIIHQEMPRGDHGHIQGFPLWANLPADQKMVDPHYRGFTDRDIPLLETAGGAIVRVIAGEVEGVRGPVGGTFTHAIEPGHIALAFCIDGWGEFAPEVEAGDREAVLFAPGDHVRIDTDDQGVRFLLVSGRPLGEPIAWRGPIVMNNEEQLREAFRQDADGTFVRTGGVPGAAGPRYEVRL